MKKLIAMFTSLLLLAVFISCDKSPSGPEKNPEKSTAYTDSANTQLGEYLTELMNNPPSDITQVDFTQINGIYRQAVNYDPTNAQANFGAAITELFMVTQNQGFQEQMNRWSDFLATSTMFGVPVNGMVKPNPSTAKLYQENPLRVEQSNEISPVTYLKALTSLPKFALDDPPKFSDFQDLIESDIIDRVNYALDRLSVVEENSDFVFYITPEMQGDASADTLELDLTEVYLFDAALQAVKSFSYMAIAYNIDLDPYDSSAIMDHLVQNGDFLTLRKSGAMQSSYDGLSGIFTKLASAVTFLSTEDDDQTNDIVVIVQDTTAENPTGITPDQISQMQMALSVVNDALNGPYLYTDDFNNDGSDQQLNVDISKIFDPEIQDFKAFLPAYTVSVGKDTVPSSIDDYVQKEVSVNVNVESAGYHYYSYSIYYYRDSGADTSSGGDLVIPELQQIVNSKYDSLMTAYGEGLDDLTVSASFYGNLEAGSQTILADYYYYYSGETAGYELVYPIITWTANSFEAWANAIPDPTFNGIFPDFNDGTELMTFFGITGDNWQKIMDLGNQTSI